ncbi:hypothetical protein QRD43_20480 [Pelomonas sp. APW6]|uniref:Uncharacterized protein n=1 Tax=Roseateles subflavus TaxID=3053353 RepID=A0ABT7LRD5_9BURK|nr:hypothetical protein [Pelomonas sp. APW6]MDL5034290.1 hypothetical protein [Pelomonas sp. APW6]
MSMSLLRALANSARSHLAALKSQARKLHAAAPDVFGHSVPLDVCQQAIARANGFRAWTEVTRLAEQVGQDRSQPAWTIHHREPLHEQCLQALYTADVELDESRAVVMLGSPEHAAVPAVCLWAEQISAQRMPGVIVIDTQAATYQKSPVGQAAKALGLAEIFQSFRVVDTRAPSLHLVLEGRARAWVSAIRCGLSASTAAQLDDRNILTILESLLDKLGRRSINNGHESGFDSYNFGYVAHLLTNHAAVLQMEWDYVDRTEVIDRFLHETHSPAVAEAMTELQGLLKALEHRLPGTGTLLASETRHRPTVILFDAHDPVSATLAALIRDMHYAPYVSTRTFRPCLYLSTQAPDRLPRLLEFGANTIVVAGNQDPRSSLWDHSATRHPLMVTVDDAELTVSGKSTTYRIDTDHPR